MKTISEVPCYSIVQKNKYKGVKTWYGRSYFQGKTKYVSLGTESRKVAQEWLEKMLVARFFGGTKLWGTSLEKMDLLKCHDEYLSVPRKENSNVTISRQLSHLLCFCRERGIDDISSFTRDDASSYVAYLQERLSKPKIFVSRAKSFFAYAYRKHGIEASSPFSDVELRKEERKEKTAWSAEEMKMLIDSAPNEHYRMLWSLMAYAGLRIHEALKFTPADIRGDSFVVDGKGNKIASLPIGTKLQHALDGYSGEWPLSQFIRATTSNHYIKSVAQKIGIREGSNHTLRHSFCTDMATRNVNIAVAQKLMRHASSQMTLDVYTHVVPKEMKKAVTIDDQSKDTGTNSSM